MNLGDGASVTSVERARHDERFRTRGVHSVAVNRYNGATVALLHQPTGRHYTMEIRAFDDGLAFRYIVPAAKTTDVRVPDEATVFNFPPRSTVWYHDLDGHYEGVHERRGHRRRCGGRLGGPSGDRAVARLDRLRIHH